MTKMQDFQIEHARPLLERTPALLRNWLSGLDSSWTSQSKGADAWSAFDVIGHLIHGERTDWVIRAEIILSDNSDKTFVPFDRFAQFDNSRGKSLADLLSEFETVRMQNLQKMDSWSLDSATLARTGSHPQFGPVTLEQLLMTWAAHDLSHIAQIARILAWPFTKPAGPWVQYMPILG